MILSKERERKARDRIKNQTCRHETTNLFVFKGAMLCICLRKPLLRTWNGGERKEKVQWVVMGGLWSEIKQTAPLQRTSFHLCDVKSKLINKGSGFQGVLSQIQGVEAFYFHQWRSPTWVNSRLASAQLSLFWYRSLFYSISLAAGRHFIAATNHLFQMFALALEMGENESLCPFREMEIAYEHDDDVVWRQWKCGTPRLL